jgi:hypothetical protein
MSDATWPAAPASLPERVTKLEAWREDAQGDLKEIRGDMRLVVRGVFGLLVAIVAWLGVQLWTGAQARIAALERAPAANSIPTPTRISP